MATGLIPFDYRGLEDFELRLEGVASCIDQAKEALAWKLVEIGKYLHEACELLGESRTGEFERWAYERCGIKRSRAYEAIQAFEKFGSSTRLDNYQVSAIVALSRDSVPDSARSEANELAARGVTITHATANEIIRAKGGKRSSPKAKQSQRSIERSDIAQWDTGEFTKHMRRHVAKWVKACPPANWSLIAEVLRELAAQLQEGNWHD